MSVEEENKSLVRRMFEELNKGNLASIDDLYAADFVWHAPGGSEHYDRETMKGMLASFLTTFPDFHVTIEDLIAEGDKVVLRFASTATHQGEYLGMAPTGKQVKSPGITIYRITGGKVVEEWAERDMLGPMQQLGAIPSG